MTAKQDSTATLSNSTLSTLSMSSTNSDHSSSPIKSAISRETAKARQDAFTRLRGSFSRPKASHDRIVAFDLESTAVYDLPKIDAAEKDLLYLSYSDKVSMADDVEETCYRFGDSDSPHPYVEHLDQVWEKTSGVTSGQVALELKEEELRQLVHGKGRGMEKKLLADMKRHRDQVVQQVLDTQKSIRLLPIGADQRAKLLRNKYKKLNARSKVFALTMANADSLAASTILGNTVLPPSA